MDFLKSTKGDPLVGQVVEFLRRASARRPLPKSAPACASCSQALITALDCNRAHLLPTHTKKMQQQDAKRQKVA